MMRASGEDGAMSFATFRKTVRHLYEGATPVFVDCEPRTYNLDTADLERKITSRTKAIMAVDVFGHPADWAEIERIARRHNLRVIDDSCEALGSEYDGRKLGGFGDDALHLRVDALEGVLVGRALGLQALGEVLDRVARLAHVLDLFAGAVLAGVRHGVAAISISQHFENDGSVAIATPFRRPVAGGLDRADIHTVDLFAGNIEGSAALGKIGQRRGTPHRRAHGVAIVLDDIDDR